MGVRVIRPFRGVGATSVKPIMRIGLAPVGIRRVSNMFYITPFEFHVDKGWFNLTILRFVIFRKIGALFQITWYSNDPIYLDVLFGLIRTAY